MIRRLLPTLFVAALTLPVSSFAAVTPPEVHADQSTFDSVKNEAVLSGHAQLNYEGAQLLADEIHYNPKTLLATAIGHVTLTRGPQRIIADEISYNFQDRTFSVNRMRLGENQVYLSGSSVTGGPHHLVVHDAVLSYHEPGSFAPTLKAKTLDYEPGQRVRAEAAHVGLGSAMPVRLPKFEQRLNDPVLSQVTVDAGSGSALGYFLRLGTHLPVFTGTTLGGDVSYYTKRGFLFEPSGTYHSTSADNDFTGRFRAGYIHDNGNKLTDIVNRPIPQSRKYFEWEHHQELGDHLTLIGELNYWSDSDVIRDFRPDEFFNVQQPDTFFEGIYTGNNYVVSLFTRVQPNTYHEVQERLPELRFDLLPTPIGNGFYERFNASAVSLREDPLPTSNPTTPRGPTLRSDRLDAYYSLTRPFTPREWLNIAPVAGGRVTQYFDATNGKSSYTRALGELGLDANLHASGVYAYKNERWDIDGIRHLVTPKISYRYIPSADKGQRYIPQIDRQVFSTYLQPLGLGDQRNIDELQATNTLRLGLDNTFQTRDKTYGSRDLLALNLAADLRFHRQPTDRELSEIHTDLAFTPIRWLEFNVYDSFAPQSGTLREFNTGLTIKDGNVWSVRFANHYLAHQIEEYIADGRYRLNEVYQVIALMHYDSRESRFVEQTFGVLQNLNNIWSVQYGLSLYSGRRREGHFGFGIHLRLLGF